MMPGNNLNTFHLQSKYTTHSTISLLTCFFYFWRLGFAYGHVVREVENILRYGNIKIIDNSGVVLGRGNDMRERRRRQGEEEKENANVKGKGVRTEKVKNKTLSFYDMIDLSWVIKYLSSLFFSWATSRSSPGSFLALYSWITPSDTLGSICSAREETQVISCKSSKHYATSSVPWTFN